MKILAPLSCALAMATPAAAQDWDFSVSLYGWFAGLGTDIGTPYGDLETDLDFSEVWDMLDMAFFGTFEARQGRWGFVGDVVYSRLSTSKDSPFGKLFTEAEVETDLTLFTGYAMYRVHETPQVRLDLGGGLRVNQIDVNVDLDGNLAADRSLDYSDSWVDPVIAARLRVPFNDRWYGTAFGDVGGFGIGDAADLTWQVAAGVGYQFNDMWSAELGYRYFSIDREFGNADVGLVMSGPIAGVTIRF